MKEREERKEGRVGEKRRQRRIKNEAEEDRVRGR